MPRKLSQEEVVRRIETLHPTLEVTGTYVNATTPLEVRCKLCGRTRRVRPSALFQGGGRCRCRNGDPDPPTDAAVAALKETRRRFPEIDLPDGLKMANEEFEAHCTICGHRWTTSLYRLLRSHGCPKCTHQPTSLAEMFLFETVYRALHPEKVLFRDHKAIGRELDIYVPGLSKAIECGSWHWHKEQLDADIAKERLCENAGIELLTIYTDVKENDAAPPKNTICIEGSVSSPTELRTMATRALIFIVPDGAERARHLNWQDILTAAKEKTDRKAIAKRFADRMAKEHPTIEILGDYIHTNKPIEVRCTICGHTWATRPKALLRGRGCPACARKKRTKRLIAASERRSADAGASFAARLAKMNPNITVVGAYAKDNEKLECSCDVCGHHWMATPSNLLRGTGCPECARRKGAKLRADHAKATFEAKMAELHPKITLLGDYTKHTEKLECACDVCGHRWMTTPDSLLRGHGCPNCANKKRGTALAAARAAKNAAKAAQNPNDSPQSGRGNTPDDSPGKETSCP